MPAQILHELRREDWMEASEARHQRQVVLEARGGLAAREEVHVGLEPPDEDALTGRHRACHCCGDRLRLAELVVGVAPRVGGLHALGWDRAAPARRDSMEAVVACE